MGHSDAPRDRYRNERERLAKAVEAGGISEEVANQIRDVSSALDPQVRNSKFTHNGEVVEHSTNTLKNYLLRLRMIAEEIDGPLLELTNDDIDGLMTDLLKGEAGIGPADGYSTGTLGQFESALKAFYRYHSAHDVDPDQIPMETSEPTSVDERDLWTVEEVEAMRSKIDSKRNEALFETLAYTGQRIRVIQTLRVKDVDPDKGDTGRYWVNEEVEGRKNRTGHGPLLGAQGAVRRWLQIHPTGEPEDALFTCSEPVRYGPGEDDVTVPGTELSQTTIREHVLKPLAERAGVDKKVHPHMFRHYFSTVALRPEARGGFGMDLQYVKRLRGDAPGSNVLETTYAHLVDEDASAHAENQYTGEVENALAPAGPCGNCGATIEAGETECSNCGAKRGPDADTRELEELRDRIEELEAQKEVQQDIGAERALANGEITEEHLDTIAESDELLSRLIEKRAAE